MTTTKRRLSEFGGIATNGGGVEGVLRAALDAIDEGGTLVFDAVRYEGNTAPGFEYAVFAPILINKSVLIEGDSPDIRLVNKTNNSPTFIVQPNRNFFFFGLENLTFISGATGLLITGSNTLSPNSRIYNVGFISQSIYSARILTPETNLHLENVWVKGGQQYGLYFANDKNHINLSIDKCKVENSSVAGIYYDNFDLNSGSVYISDTELNDNNQALVVNNLRYYEHNVEYFQNGANYVLSGSSSRLTGSAGGGGGGGGVTDHGLLTGLNDDDHKQYLLINGVRGMSASLNMNGFNVFDVGLVDGVDVALLDSTLDSHLLDVNNPHSTKFSNLVPETLSALNSAISDANVVSEASFYPFSASIQFATASYQVFSASIQQSTASLQTISASYLNSSASFETRINTQIQASASFNSQFNILFNNSASFRSDINNLQGFSQSFKSFSSSIQSQTASIQIFSASTVAASASYSIRFDSLTSSVAFLTSASSSTEARFATAFTSTILLSSSYLSTSASFRSELNNLQSFSSSHASRHLSGGADPIDAHLLRANGIGANRVLMSDGIGGWITVLSSTFGGSGGGGKDYDAFTASLQVFTASQQSATASLQTTTASLLAASSSFAVVSSSYQFVSASYNATSASYNSFSASYVGTSASFDSKLNSLQEATSSLQSASSSFLAFSSSHASRHLSGSSDAIDAQLLRADGVTANRVLISNGLGGWSTATSQSLGASPSNINPAITRKAVVGSSGSSENYSREDHSHSFPYSTRLILGSDGLSPISPSNDMIEVEADVDVEIALPASTFYTSFFISKTDYSSNIITLYPNSGDESINDNDLGESYVISGSGDPNAKNLWFVYLDSNSTNWKVRQITTNIEPLNLATGVLQSSIASLQVFSASQLAVSSSFNAISASYISTSASFGERLNSLQAASASYQVFSATIQNHTASVQLFTASSLVSSASFAIASSSYASFSSSFPGTSASFNARLNSVQSSTASLQTHTASIQTFSSSMLLASSSFSGVSASFVSFSASQTENSASFDSKLNQILQSTASLQSASASFQTFSASIQNFSASHASRHLSGGLDPIDAQSLRANGIGADRVLISDGLGGWTTVLSSAFGGGGPGNNYDAFTASIQLFTASTQNATASLQTTTASLIAGSASFAVVSSSYQFVSASHNAISASYISTSATFNSRLNSIQSSTASLQTTTASLQTFSSSMLLASSSFAVVSSSYISFSSSYLVASSSFNSRINGHGSQHLSGGIDPIDAQSLRADGIAGNRVLISDGLGGWTTVSSSSFGGGSAPAPTGSVLVTKGFNSFDLGDRYSATTTGIAPGGTDFLVCCLAAPLSIGRNGAGVQVVAGNTDGATGWRIAWTYGVLTFIAYDSTGGIVETGVGSAYDVSKAGGKLHPFILRARQVGGNLSVEGWIGSSQVAVAVAGGSGIAPATAGTLSLGYASIFGQELPLSGGVYGLGYYSGTVTDEQIRTIGGRSLIEGAIPEDVISWDVFYRGSDLALTTSIVSSSVGLPTLTKIGSPTPANEYLHTGGSSASPLSSSGGGGITTVLSATSEGRTLISGVIGDTLYLKNLKVITSSVDGTQLADTSPIILSSSADAIYFKRRPTSKAQYFFDDFTNAVVTAAGFGWTFVAGGTGGGIAVQDVDANNFTDQYGSSIGALVLDTGTTAAGGCILRNNPTAFSMRQMTGSSLEWRIAVSGTHQPTAQEYRIHVGWTNAMVTGTRRPTNGIFFEHTGTNPRFWNICAVSGASMTVYNSGVPLKTTGSFQELKIETIQRPLGAFTATFYIDNAVVGQISSSIPVSRNQSLGPTLSIAKEIGIAQRDLVVDWCEIFYEIDRE